MTSDWLAQTGTSAARTRLVERVELDARVMAARRRGLTYARIAEMIQAGDDSYLPQPEITATDVAKVCKAHLKRQAEETAEDTVEARMLEVERLDALVRRWQPIAETTGDEYAGPAMEASKVLLRISKRRAELLGLDAPKQVDVRVSGSILHELEASEDDLEAEMLRRAEQGFDAEATAIEETAS